AVTPSATRSSQRAAIAVASVGWAATRADENGNWMMSRFGSGMMGYAARDGEPVRNLAEAKAQAQRFADRLDLEVGEVMRFSNHYYAELQEEDGTLATEVLVDPSSGAVWLEYGPAMMWNTRYGMMSDFRLRESAGVFGGGMMGGGMMGGPASGSSPSDRTSDVTPAEATAIAARWLDRVADGVTAGEPELFPGYYTLHVLEDGKIAGMLSVNATTGDVWSHWWHGRFVSMSE
ncbi:MAG TPA: hypothetical protein VIG93_09370, partial [Gaiellaceae bacterium]